MLERWASGRDDDIESHNECLCFSEARVILTYLRMTTGFGFFLAREVSRLRKVDSELCSTLLNKVNAPPITL